jgi:hypothetical protein
MNRILTRIIALSMIAGVVVTGCSKTSTDVLDTNTPTTSSSTPSPKFNDAAGSMAAVTSVSYQTVAGYTIPVYVNTAVAVFFASPGSSSYVDAGTVSVNSKNFTKQSNNTYLYQNLTDPLTLSSTNAWNVTGSGSVPAISYTYNRNMPAYGDYSSLPGTVTRSAGLTVDLGSSVTDADSVYVVVTSGSTYIIKHCAGNAGEASFSASELSKLAATSTGLLQVVPWNYTSSVISGNKYYFVNEAAYTKSVSVN